MVAGVLTAAAGEAGAVPLGKGAPTATSQRCPGLPCSGLSLMAAPVPRDSNPFRFKGTLTGEAVLRDGDEAGTRVPVMVWAPSNSAWSCDPQPVKMTKATMGDNMVLLMVNNCSFIKIIN
jgi:hypothetical protein